MNWVVLFHPAFAVEFEELVADVQDELAAQLQVLSTLGPQLGRPRADTLKGSRHANMKELRFDADGGVWRAAFAFDPARQAIVLVAGDKSGQAQSRFYRRLIAVADQRFEEHLAPLRGRRKP
ncbi:MAG: type II toxin-antitoxin system RelE/ParE family toxin [Pseudomonadota bacterium]